MLRDVLADEMLVVDGVAAVLRVVLRDEMRVPGL